MSTNSSMNYTSSSGVTLLTILFIGLKLANQIDWSWWWVLSPLWISLGLLLGIAIIVLLTILIIWAVGKAKELYRIKHKGEKT